MKILMYMYISIIFQQTSRNQEIKKLFNNYFLITSWKQPSSMLSVVVEVKGE